MKGIIAFLLAVMAIVFSAPALAADEPVEPVSKDERLLAEEVLRSEVVSLGKRSRQARKAVALRMGEPGIDEKLAQLTQLEDELVEAGVDYAQLLQMQLPPRTWRILTQARRRDFEALAKRLRKALDDLDPPKDDDPPSRRPSRQYPARQYA